MHIYIYTGSDFGSAKLFEVTGLEGSQFRFRDAQPADGRQLRARLGSGQRFPCSVLDVPILDMGRQMTAVGLQKRKRHFTLDSLWIHYDSFITPRKALTHQASNLFLRSTSEFHDSREGHALQRLVDACFGRELRNVMEKKTAVVVGGFGSWIWIEKTEGFDMFWSLSSINHTIWGTRTLNQSA